jgi:DNA-binding LytR/AlgR family response regulator
MNTKHYPESQEIMYLEADVNYTIFHLENGNKLLSSSTLLVHQNKLQGFIRVNRKHLINPIYISHLNLESKSKAICLKSGLELKVSRRWQETLKTVI